MQVEWQHFDRLWIRQAGDEGAVGHAEAGQGRQIGKHLPGQAGEGGEEVAGEVEVGEVGVDQPRSLATNRIGKAAVAGTQLIEIGEVGEEGSHRAPAHLVPVEDESCQRETFAGLHHLHLFRQAIVGEVEECERGECVEDGQHLLPG